MAYIRFTVAVALISGFAVRHAAQAQTILTDSTRLQYVGSEGGHVLTRPQKALLLSSLLPGAGQLYNHKYWKLPIAYGALGGVGYGLRYYQVRYREYARGKRDLLAGKTLPELNGKLVSQEQSERGVEAGLDRYRTKRDTFVGYMALTYGLVMLDALVDAHLREFDISEDITLHLKPGVMPVVAGNGIAAGLQLHLQLKPSASSDFVL